MAETPEHRDTIVALDLSFAANPMVYVSGNMFIYYVMGDRRRCLAPDVFVVRGIPKQRQPPRRRYLTWEEGKGPDMVIEFTSVSTREEDIDDKLELYRDALKVPEYFLFDPYEEYLEPSLQGHRLVNGQWVAIEPVGGRLPSEILGLHMERSGDDLRLYNPATGGWLPLAREERELREQAEEERRRAEAGAARAHAEIERLRRELEELRRQLPSAP
jgi:Uma2 family endonuclease